MAFVSSNRSSFRCVFLYENDDVLIGSFRIIIIFARCSSDKRQGEEIFSILVADKVELGAILNSRAEKLFAFSLSREFKSGRFPPRFFQIQTESNRKSKNINRI